MRGEDRGVALEGVGARRGQQQQRPRRQERHAQRCSAARTAAASRGFHVHGCCQDGHLLDRRMSPGFPCLRQQSRRSRAGRAGCARHCWCGCPALWSGLARWAGAAVAPGNSHRGAGLLKGACAAGRVLCYAVLVEPLRFTVCAFACTARLILPVIFQGGAPFGHFPHMLKRRGSWCASTHEQQGKGVSSWPCSCCCCWSAGEHGAVAQGHLEPGGARPAPLGGAAQRQQVQPRAQRAVGQQSRHAACAIPQQQRKHQEESRASRG